MRLLPISFLVAASLTGCNIPLRYQDTEHYKSRQQAKSARIMEQHQRLEAVYIKRAEKVSSEVAKNGSKYVLDAARNNVADLLKDPDSAKFRNVRFVMHEGGALICGEVNGKNAYGGYVGYKQFLSDSQESEIYDSDSIDERYTTKVFFKCTSPVHKDFQNSEN